MKSLRVILLGVEKLEPLEIGIYSHPTPRNWVVITDPVKCMEDIPFRGGQGFRYTQELF
jgi:hypothetical protein